MIFSDKDISAKLIVPEINSTKEFLLSRTEFSESVRKSVRGFICGNVLFAMRDSYPPEDLFAAFLRLQVYDYEYNEAMMGELEKEITDYMDSAKLSHVLAAGYLPQLLKVATATGKALLTDQISIEPMESKNLSA